MSPAARDAAGRTQATNSTSPEMFRGTKDFSGDGLQPSLAA